MTLPDRIERTVHLPHDRERVWAALTTAEGLGTWFGNRAVVDLRVGGEARLEWDSGDTATLTFARLEPPAVVAWTWGISGLDDADPRRTHVEFVLQEQDGGTRLTVVESGFAQLADPEQRRVAVDGNTEGWRSELAELVTYLDAAA